VSIGHHVPGQLIYPFGEQGYLNFSRARISFTEPEFAYDFGLLIFFQVYNPSMATLFFQIQDYPLNQPIITQPVKAVNLALAGTLDFTKNSGYS
jgi:hypothetical protein